jgi:transposase
MEKPISEYAAVVGIDWADRKHDICLLGQGGERVERSVLEHHPVKIREWANRLRERFGGAPIAVCLELSQGPIVSALLEYDFFVIYPVQPAMLARYRKTFTPSGAKDDPTDAEYALDMLRRHPEQFEPLKLESAAMRSLRKLVEARRDLVDDRVRVTNRLTYALKAYFPQVLSWFRDKDTQVFMDFIERWPSLQAAKRARSATVEDFFRSHNVRRKATISRRVEDIKEALPLTTDPAIIEPAQVVVETLLPQLRALVDSIERLDDEIEKVCARLPDYRLFATLPGAGRVFASRLLAAFGEQRGRFPNAASLQKYAGVAPVTKRSGKSHTVHWRWACPTFLRQTFVEWTAQTIPRSFWAKAFYERHRARGASHNATVRALAYKWIRILWRCWVDQKPYDESRYLDALRKRHSPLLKYAADSSN